MAYLSLIDLDGSIPAQFLLQALDDDNDQVIDAAVWTKVLAAAEEEVDSFLEGRFTLPLTTVPKLMKQATQAFVCELLYRRRGTPDETNPWKKQADGLRKRLAQVQAGDLKLSAAPDSDAIMPDPAAVVILEDSTLGSTGRRLA
jgi:phage gp36-like protein